MRQSLKDTQVRKLVKALLNLNLLSFSATVSYLKAIVIFWKVSMTNYLLFNY